MKQAAIGLAATSILALSSCLSFAQQAPAQSGGAAGPASTTRTGGGMQSTGSGAGGMQVQQGGAAAPSETQSGKGMAAPAAQSDSGASQSSDGELRPKTPQGTAASPGMKPDASETKKPATGARQNGENVGVSPGTKPEQVAPKQGAAEGQSRTSGGERGGSAPRLSGEQRTHVLGSFRHAGIKPVHVDFKISVGVAVPRTVVLAPVPADIVTYVPEYRRFRYFVVPGEIVIVDPDTLEIVDVLPL